PKERCSHKWLQDLSLAHVGMHFPFRQDTRTLKTHTTLAFDLLTFEATSPQTVPSAPAYEKGYGCPNHPIGLPEPSRCAASHLLRSPITFQMAPCLLCFLSAFQSTPFFMPSPPQINFGSATSPSAGTFTFL
uniref:Uncharacterized protein n=1 Tax=Apteryx owenii TaxID=8824 RepID=A0A8B9PIG9_APTOW